VLSRRLAEQTTLNQKLIRAKLQGEISAEDFQTFKASITGETARINEQIIALDAERSTMQDLCQQAEVQTLNLVLAWERANANQRQELVRGLFPEGLHFSHEKKFFEPAMIRDMQLRWLESFLAGKDDDSLVGVPKLPFLNHISPARERLYAICTEYDIAGTTELGCSEVSDLTI